MLGTMATGGVIGSLVMDWLVAAELCAKVGDGMKG
jgi:hypothetical protein